MRKINQKEHYFYIDILRILACLCVIYMQCNRIADPYTDTSVYRQRMFVETIAYWAVPVFFMISGATLFDYRERYQTGAYFKKRFLKTGLPFITWTLINLVIKVALGQMEFRPSLSGMIDLFTNTTAEQVYWFFIPLFMMYLCIPVLSLLKDYKQILAYMTAMAFLAYSVYPVCCTFLGISFNGNIQFPVAGGYLLYVILGYLLSTTDMSKKTRMFLCILGATGAGIRYISTVAWSTNSSGLNHAFWGYLSFPTVFLAVGVFVAVKYGPWKKLEQNPGIRRAVTTLASTGQGVYVTHMLVLQTFQNLTKLGTESGWWRFVMPFVIYVISVMSVLILKKIPVFRAIVP